ncbi:MAG: DNA-directed RNA polymerase subunit omega [Bacteroidetes bacterium]|nr:DNA-directed RNA polymerase subunit omega [Bacteroidota bacterium]
MNGTTFMAIKTVDVDKLVDQTGNLFETVAILSKRSRQVAIRMKSDLDTRLAYFEGFDPELEDPQFQEEQRRISIEHEVQPKPTEVAIGEMFNSEVYFRDPTSEILG